MIFWKKRKVEADIGETMMHKKLNFAATEAYKLLRTNIFFTLPDENKCRVIGVTSAIRGEGKSTTSVNLSYTLAETGKKVLIIDADLRLPTVAKKLDVEVPQGLSNVLAGIVDESQVINVSKELPNWHYITSGDIPPNPTEMLGSQQMKSLIERLSEIYDFIIVDVPPVNIVSDALIVSSFLDGMLVVVRENYSGRRELQHCMRQLELSDVRVLGFVINSSSDNGKKYSKYKKNKRYYKRGDYGYEDSYGDYSYAQASKKTKKDSLNNSSSKDTKTSESGV